MAKQAGVRGSQRRRGSGPRGPSSASGANQGVMGVRARNTRRPGEELAGAGQAGRATGMAGTPDSSFHTLATGDRLLGQPRGLLCPQLATSPRSGPSGQFRTLRVQPPAPGYTPKPPTPPPAPALRAAPPPARGPPGTSPLRAGSGGRKPAGKEGGRERGRREAGPARGWATAGPLPPTRRRIFPRLPPGPRNRPPRPLGLHSPAARPAAPARATSRLPSSLRPGARLPGRPQPPRTAPPPVFLPLQPLRSLPPSSPLSPPPRRRCLLRYCSASRPPSPPRSLATTTPPRLLPSSGPLAPATATPSHTSHLASWLSLPSSSSGLNLRLLPLLPGPASYSALLEPARGHIHLPSPKGAEGASFCEAF